MAKSQHTLAKIEIQCKPQAEEAVAEVIENVFEVSAFSVENHESGEFVVSAFLPNPSMITAEKKKEFRHHIDELKKNIPDLGTLNVRYSTLKDEDWTESWKHHFKPLIFGKTLVVKPPWEKALKIPGAKNVIIDPGLAFGTGNHPTTKFCLQQIVKFRPKKNTSSFLDIGTGSGVLAIAAAKLGYSPTTAFDFDPVAVEVAKNNAIKNRVAHKINLYTGDVLKMDEIPSEKYDMICANISDDILVQTAKTISSILNEKGKLSVAGILEKNFDSVKNAYTSAGLKLLSVKKEKEWKSGLFIKTT